MRDGNRVFGTSAGTSATTGGNFAGNNLTAANNEVSPYAGAHLANSGTDAFDLEHSENGFNFVGEDSLGTVVKGFVQTTEAQLAEKELERAGIHVQSINPRRGVRKKNRRPKGIEYATLAEQFGDLMEVGQSPTQICRLLAYAQTNAVLADALLDAGELIMNGRSLSEAFAAQRDSKGEPLFPVTFICALRIGEEVGTASDLESGASRSAFLLTLHRFAEAEKKADAIRTSITWAMMYPVAVIVFCIVAVGIVEYFVMPKMVDLYTSLLTGENQKLPIITRIMIGGSDFVTSWWGIATLIGVLLGTIAFTRWARSSAGKDSLKVFALRLPVFGSFFRHYYAGPNTANSRDAVVGHSVDVGTICCRRRDFAESRIRRYVAARQAQVHD
jgi:type II secretory pathway component PulF